jgi:toxin ParE1/3/4
MMNYTFHPHAEKELEEIEGYYDSTRKELGNQFRNEMRTTLSRILEFPNAWPSLIAPVRRCRINRFPYEIVYQLKTGEVYVLAVRHERREPNYWMYRL